MKKVNLAGSAVALIDDIDFSKVSRYSWSVAGNRYARAAMYDIGRGQNGRLKQRVVKMHRLILDAGVHEQVDHVNGNGLDNRRKNIRICTQSQNMCNQKKSVGNKSGYKGVIEMKGEAHQRRKKKWLVYISVNKKRIYGGYFFTREEGAQKYNEMAGKYHGEFANLNII